MWFVGMLVGAVIGGIGNGSGVVIGGIVGIILGAIIGSKMKRDGAADARLTTLEDAVRQLNERIKALESGAPVTTAAPVLAAESAPLSVAPPVPEVPMPQTTAEAPSVVTPSSEPAPQAAAVVAEANWAADARGESSVPLEPVEPGKPREPSEPSAIWNFFFGGNTLVRVGIMVLFAGVAFLLKYAVDAGFVPIELRLAGVAAGGIALLVTGWRLRLKRAGYALMLQGGGIGILYLTVFAGLKLYGC